MRLLAAFAAAFALSISLVAVGEIVAGDEAFDSLWLTAPLTALALTAVAAGLCAGVAAAFAVVRRRERAALAFVPLGVLVLLVIFIAGELAGHD